MRFSPKFGATAILYVTLACANLYFWIAANHPTPLLGLNAIVWTGLALLQVLNSFMIYWETDSERLFERRLWRTTEVPWNELTHVGALNPQKPSSETIAIDYYRPAPLSERGQIIANPVDRQQFIDTLRRLAPQASFEV